MGASDDSLTVTSRHRLRPAVRLALLVLLLGGLAVAGVASGLTETLSVASLRAWMVEAGALGIFGFLLLFALGTLLQVPGMVFVVAAALAWGQLGGGAIALAGAMLSVSSSFFLVRAVGGRLLADVDRPFVKRLLARLDRAPIRTVAALRLVLWVSPPLTYALALSRVPTRAHALGSILGLTLPVVVAATFVDALV